MCGCQNKPTPQDPQQPETFAIKPGECLTIGTVTVCAYDPTTGLGGRRMDQDPGRPKPNVPKGGW
jgi:hypothetical protein